MVGKEQVSRYSMTPKLFRVDVPIDRRIRVMATFRREYNCMESELVIDMSRLRLIGLA